MQGGMGGIVVTLLVALVGFVLVSVFAPVVLDNFATSGGNANIGSFSGAKSFNDMFPLFFFIVGLLMILGPIGIGGAALAGKGPLRRR